MIQNLIQTKYDLEVIGLIQLSPKVYKVKTKQGFYCVKIIQEKKLENAYQHIQTLHLHHFISIIKNKEDHYFTPYQDKFIYLMPYLVYKNAIQKEIKIKMYYQIIAYLHKKSFFIQSEDISFFERQKENLLSLIQIRKDEFERMMKEFEFKKYKAPSGWMLVLNYYRIIEFLNQSRYYLSRYFESVKEKKEIRLSLIYHHFDLNHIFVDQQKLISIDQMKINYCIYDLVELFQNQKDLYECVALFDGYLEEIGLYQEEKLLLLCLLSIVPHVSLNEDENNNIQEMAKLICYMDGIVKIFKKIEIDEV